MRRGNVEISLNYRYNYLMLGIDGNRENLIRSAFQCLQLVVTDYLPILPCNCLPLAVETTCKFGSQTQELNVSLTAIGLMVRLT